MGPIVMATLVRPKALKPVEFYIGGFEKNLSSDKSFEEDSHSSISKNEGPTYSIVAEIPEAHSAKINAMIQLGQEGFASAGQEGEVKIWNISTKSEGKWVFKKAITALSTIKASNWVTGSEDGTISVFDQPNKLLSSFSYKPGLNNSPCIKAICDNPFNINSFFTGTEKFVQQWSKKGSLLSYEKVEGCANQFFFLSNRSFVVGIDNKIEVWNLDNNKFNKKSLFKANSTLSCMTALDQNSLVFGEKKGPITIIDSQNGKVSNITKEHIGSVLSIVQRSPYEFITGHDNYKMMFWDSRSKKSIVTLDSHNGTITAMLYLSEFLLAAASDSNKSKSSIAYWDVRVLKGQ